MLSTPNGKRKSEFTFKITSIRIPLPPPRYTPTPPRGWLFCTRLTTAAPWPWQGGGGSRRLIARPCPWIIWIIWRCRVRRISLIRCRSGRVRLRRWGRVRVRVSEVVLPPPTSYLLNFCVAHDALRDNTTPTYDRHLRPRRYGHCLNAADHGRPLGDGQQFTTWAHPKIERALRQYLLRSGVEAGLQSVALHENLASKEADPTPILAKEVGVGAGIGIQLGRTPGVKMHHCATGRAGDNAVSAANLLAIHGG
jgi:hypothetical protein